MWKLVTKHFFSNRLSGLLIFFAIISQILSLIFPLLNGDFIDALISHPTRESVITLSVILALIAILSIILSCFVNIISAIINNRVQYKIQKDYLIYIEKTYFEYIASLPPALVAQRIQTDAATITNFVLSNLTAVWLKFFQLIIPVIYVSIVYFPFTVLIATVSVLYVIVVLVINPSLKKIIENYKNAESLFFSKIEHFLNSLEDVKFNLHEAAIGTYLNNNYAHYIKYFKKLNIVSNLFSTVEGFVSALFQASIFFAGGMAILSGKITLGEFISVNTYFVLILSAVRYYMNLFKNSKDAEVAYQRLNYFFKLPKEPSLAVKIKEKQICVRVSNLSFRYPNSLNNIFKNLNFEFNENGVYVIKGLNGSGKTTLIKLLLGYFHKYDGEIIINNQNIRDINLSDYRCSNIVYVPQKITFLSDKTDDILYERAGINSNNFNQRIHNSKFFGLFESLSKSVLNNQIGELSAGELKKIALLIAFSKSSPVYILDEPQANLDYKSCDSLVKLLIKFSDKSKIIVINHSREFDKCAKQIIHILDKDHES